jgi:hypothetical protein
VYSYCEKQIEHVNSMGTKQNLNFNSGGSCLLFDFKRFVVSVIARLVNLFQPVMNIKLNFPFHSKYRRTSVDSEDIIAQVTK